MTITGAALGALDGLQVHTCVCTATRVHACAHGAAPVRISQVLHQADSTGAAGPAARTVARLEYLVGGREPDLHSKPRQALPLRFRAPFGVREPSPSPLRTAVPARAPLPLHSLTLRLLYPLRSSRSLLYRAPPSSRSPHVVVAVSGWFSFTFPIPYTTPFHRLAAYWL